MKKDKLRKIDAIRNKKEANMLKSLQIKKKLDVKLEEFKDHERLLSDKIVTHENTLKKLAKKSNKKNGLSPISSIGGKNYKQNAKYQVEVLEK